MYRASVLMSFLFHGWNNNPTTPNVYLGRGLYRGAWSSRLSVLMSIAFPHGMHDVYLIISLSMSSYINRPINQQGARRPSNQPINQPITQSRPCGVILPPIYHVYPYHGLVGVVHASQSASSVLLNQPINYHNQ